MTIRDTLIRELEKEAPSMIEYEGDRLVIRHVYIERRMVPLNLYLQHGSAGEIEHSMKEYGDAIKQLMQANISFLATCFTRISV